MLWNYGWFPILPTLGSHLILYKASMHSFTTVGGRSRVLKAEMWKPRYLRRFWQLRNGKLLIGEQVMINDFSAFNLAPEEVSYVLRASRMIWSLSVVVTIAKSSQCDWLFTLFSSSSWKRGSIDRINRMGARGSPCWTPDRVWNVWESLLLTMTLPVPLWWIARRSVASAMRNPEMVRQVDSYSWKTLLYAFSLSTNSKKLSGVFLIMWEK